MYTVISRFQLVCSYLSETVLGQVSVGESVPDLDTANETLQSTQAIFVSITVTFSTVLCVFSVIFVDLSFISSANICTLSLPLSLSG